MLHLTGVLTVAALVYFRNMSPPATTFKKKDFRMLYLTGVLTVAALVYLCYVMIRPEKF